MTTAISDWQDQADAKISADYSWRRGVFESTGSHRGDRLTDLGAAAARRRSEAGVQIGGYGAPFLLAAPRGVGSAIDAVDWLKHA
jgi:hypothetical protein